MNIDHLKYVIEVERYGSISKAADALYMTQPYLSKVIHDLEDELNVKIFERSNRGVVVTDKGRDIINKIYDIMDDVESLQDLGRAQHGPRSFAVATTTAGYTAAAFRYFLKKTDFFKDRARVVYHETDSNETFNLVASGIYHFGIIRLYNYEIPAFNNLAKSRRIKSIPLRHFTKMAIMSKNNPLASKDTISIKDLKDQIEILHTDIRYSDERIAFVESFVEMAGIERVIKMHGRESIPQFLREFTNSFFWVSPLEEAFLKRHDLVQKRCVDYEIKATDIFIYSKDYELDDDAKLLIQCIHEALEIIDDDITD